MIIDEEARERIRAYIGATGCSMAEFGEGMKRLTGTLAATAHSMGQLAQAELESEAAELAAESIYTREQWRHALACIGNRPDRREIARLCGQAAVRQGTTPYAIATELIGDEDRPGVLAGKAAGG